MSRHAATLDWVEGATGQPYGHVCDREGHDWQVDGPIDPVGKNDTPAAFLLCTRCGHRGYHWLPPHVQARLRQEGVEI